MLVRELIKFLQEYCDPEGKVQITGSYYDGGSDVYEDYDAVAVTKCGWVFLHPDEQYYRQHAEDWDWLIRLGPDGVILDRTAPDSE